MSTEEKRDRPTPHSHPPLLSTCATRYSRTTTHCRPFLLRVALLQRFGKGRGPKRCSSIGGPPNLLKPRRPPHHPFNRSNRIDSDLLFAPQEKGGGNSSGAHPNSRVGGTAAPTSTSVCGGSLCPLRHEGTILQARAASWLRLSKLLLPPPSLSWIADMT